MKFNLNKKCKECGNIIYPVSIRKFKNKETKQEATINRIYGVYYCDTCKKFIEINENRIHGSGIKGKKIFSYRVLFNQDRKIQREKLEIAKLEAMNGNL